MKQVIHFTTDNGVEPFGKWFGKLKDVKAMATIVRRLRKIEREGYFGDHASIKGADDLYELRIFVGPGYRVYYGLDGDRIVVILGGSDKGRQADAIAQAKTHWSAYRNR